MAENSGKKSSSKGEGIQSSSGKTRLFCGLTLILVSTIVVLTSLTPVLEYLELANYDALVRFRSERLPTPEDSPIVIVEFTEDEIDDLAFWDYPIPDRELTALLSRVAECNPVVIGVDIVRSAPVPKTGEGYGAFQDLLETDPRIVMVKKFGDASVREIPAPPVLEAIEDPAMRWIRIGFADFPVDSGLNQRTRRGLLHQAHEEEECYSLSFVLASWYLSSRGIAISQTEEGDALLGENVLPAIRSGGGGYSWKSFSERSSVLLNFPNKDPFQRISFSEVMAPDFDATRIDGKIVLVGITAESVHDSASTPLLNDHRGIVVHSLFTQQLLDIATDKQVPTKVLPEPLEILWIILACVLGGLCGFFALRLRVLIPSVLAVVVGISFLCVAAFLHFFWLPSAAPLLGLLFSAAAVNLTRGAVDRRDRKIIEILFGKAVGEEFSKAIWNERRNILQSGRMLPREMPATILMTDLKNFTTLSRKLNAQELFEWLNDYLGMISSIIGENGGVSKDFAGDAVHGAFGLPIRRETDAEIDQDATNAVLSALQMREAMTTINEDLSVQEKVSMRVGIATGSVISGSLGSSHLMRFDFVGEVANLASRLESVRDDRLPDDEGCRILVNEETWNRLGGKFPGEDAGEFDLKGTGRTRIFRIL